MNSIAETDELQYSFEEKSQLKNQYINVDHEINNNDSNLHKVQMLNSELFNSLPGLNDPNNLGPVKGIFLCEFHPTLGRKIVAQVPENFISKEVFHIVNHYVIPKIHLERSFVSVSLLGIKILGYPVRIDHKSYPRNAFLFNICFVFEPATRTIGYEPMIRKLADYMLSMELSTKALSLADAIHIQRISQILYKVHKDINKKQMCMLQEGNAILSLCVVPHYTKKIHVNPYEAVVLKDNFSNFDESQWDLTTLRILPYVNGFNHIHRIAAMADVALGLVINCVKHWILLGVAVTIPLFQYCNVYRPTTKLSLLAKSKELQNKCIDRCSKTRVHKASIRDIFRLFASMAHGATFGELCVRFNPIALNINERQLVLFGLLEGLIRRVDRYPVTVSRDLFADYMEHSANKLIVPTLTAVASTALKPQENVMSEDDIKTKGIKSQRKGRVLPRGDRTKSKHQFEKQINNVFTGLNSFDEICCTYQISSQQLEAYLAADKHAIVLLK